MLQKHSLLKQPFLYNIDTLENMAENDKNIDRLESLLFEVKKYIELQRDVVKLDFTEKLTVIFSGAILVLVLAVMGLLVLLTCSFMLVYVLNDYLNNLILSSGIVCLSFIILTLIIYWKRDLFITRIVVNFLGKLFLEKNDKKKP